MVTLEDPLDRILGSADLRAAARSIITIGSDPNDEERRVMTQGKNSGGKPGKSIAYRIDDEIGVDIEGYCDLSRFDIVNRKQGSRVKQSVSLDEAMDFIEECLSEQGFCATDWIKDEAENRGISKTTLYRAKKEMGVETQQSGKGKEHISLWYREGIDPKEVLEQIKINPALLQEVRPF
jgi:hypothetical protein